MRLRLEFSRGRRMAYLSHLDLMRLFSRALRRGGIPVSYTTGFNPRAQMVFGLPLQVGMTGEAEYLDIILDAPAGDAPAADTTAADTPVGDAPDVRGQDDYKAIVDKINAVLPEGVAVSCARHAAANENIMSIISHAAYEMRVGLYPDGGASGPSGAAGERNAPDGAAAVSEAAAGHGFESDGAAVHDVLSRAIAGFLLPGPRIAAKTQGGGTDVRYVDVAPLVRSICARGDTLCMVVKAGSVDNVRPDMVLETLNAVLKEGGAKLYRISLHRKALYTERGGELLSPISDLAIQA